MEPLHASPVAHASSLDATCARKIQALFRGRRCRLLHVDRVRRNLPWSPFVPAKAEAVDAMLRLARLRPGDTLLDVGSGDGRVLLAAAALPVKLKAAVGVEIDGALVAMSRRRILESADCGTATDVRVSVIHADWLDVDMQDVDVVILFFLPHEDTAAILQSKLRPGTRVVTYVFQIKPWVPDAVATTVPFMTEKGHSSIYRYTVPSPSPQPTEPALSVPIASAHTASSA